MKPLVFSGSLPQGFRILPNLNACLQTRLGLGGLTKMPRTNFLAFTKFKPICILNICFQLWKKLDGNGRLPQWIWQYRLQEQWYKFLSSKRKSIIVKIKFTKCLYDAFDLCSNTLEAFTLQPIVFSFTAISFSYLRYYACLSHRIKYQVEWSKYETCFFKDISLICVTHSGCNNLLHYLVSVTHPRECLAHFETAIFTV